MEPEGTPQTAVKFVRKNSKHRGSLKTVLIMLADFIDDGNNCPSQSELAEATGLSKSTVRHALGELEREGVITRTKNGGKRVKGGHKDCYSIAGFKPVTPQAELKPAIESVPVETIPVETIVAQTIVTETIVTTEPVEYVHEDIPARGDAAGEKDLSLGQEKKDKKHPLPAKAGKEPGRAKPVKPSRELREPTEAGLVYIDLLNAIREVFGAVKVEATNYANMLTGRAKKGLWGQCAFEMPVSADELRRWWRWYHGKYPNIDRLKEPPKVYSSITEWREVIKPRQAAAQAAFPVPRMAPVLVDGLTGMHQTIPDSVYDQLRPSWKVPR